MSHPTNEFHSENPLSPPSSSPSARGSHYLAASVGNEEKRVIRSAAPFSIAVWTPAARRRIDQSDVENSPQFRESEVGFDRSGALSADRMKRNETARGNLTPFADHGDGCWGWQLPLFPGFFPALPPIDDPKVSNDLDDRLPEGDMPGQLLLDLDLDL